MKFPLRFVLFALVGVTWTTASDESNLKRYLEPADAPHNQEPRSFTTDNTFLPGPNGELCILDDRDIHDPTYEHRDEHGRWCCCSVCKPGHYVRGFCQCDEGKEMPSPVKDTDCVHVKIGSQYMDKHNNCTRPYECSAGCNEHQHKVSDCTHTADLACECDDGWFNPDPLDNGNIPKTCRQKPHCIAGEEWQQIKEAGLYEFICVPCPRGHFKAEGGNLKGCERRRNCLIQRGSATADNVCLNDDVAASQPKTQELRMEEQPITKQDALPTPSPAYPEQSFATDKPTLSPEPRTSESTPPADELSKTSAPVEQPESDTSTPKPDPHPVDNICLISFPASYMFLAVIAVIVVIAAFFVFLGLWSIFVIYCYKKFQS